MRQAGRSLPEYRAIRGEGTILDAIADPDLSTEITLQPIRRYDVDAAILYSDIVVPAHAVGFGLTVTPGVGPEVEHPFRHEDDLARLRPLDPEADTPYVLETVRQLVAELDRPLIGFAGAPFTVASYLIEGRPSRDYVNTKAMMFANEPLWHALCDRLADMAITSLRSQIDNGASAIQLFDSWAGSLSPAQYQRYVFPHSEKVMSAIADTGVPKIHFGVTTGELLPQIGAVGADVVGVDWRIPDGTEGVGRGTALSSDTGRFWFFNPANIELVVKVLDGSCFNERIWVFYGALSNVEYTIRVTDTATCASRIYFNPQDNFASVGDTNAFVGENTGCPP